MSRTLKRLPTAAAATSDLALIPLAATAAPAATATARSQAGGLGTSANWGGYVLHANQGQRFRGVQAAFTVPRHVMRKRAPHPRQQSVLRQRSVLGRARRLERPAAGPGHQQRDPGPRDSEADPFW